MARMGFAEPQFADDPDPPDPREAAARALERAAAEGDVKAITALAAGVADRLRGVADEPDEPDDRDREDPSVAAAWLRVAAWWATHPTGESPGDTHRCHACGCTDCRPIPGGSPA